MYNSLLENGPLVASKISDEAVVPYSKVYEVLGSLGKKGWVEIEHGRPSKYYPASPSTALEAHRLKTEREIAESGSQVLNELQPIFDGKEARERPDIWIMRGEFNILSKVRETVERCKSELLVAIPGLLEEVVDILAPTITALKEKGVRLMVMTTRNVDAKLLERLTKFAEVKVREQMFGGGIVSDMSEVVLLLGEDRQAKSPLAIWSDHLGLARLAKTYFEYLWNEATFYYKTS